MFHVKGKVEIFREVFDVVRTVIEEVKINFTPEAMRIRAVDPGHISMVDLEVKKDAFEEFETEGKELGVNIEKIRKVISLAAAGTDIDLHIAENTSELVIQFGHIERKMLLIDATNLTEPNLPDLELPGMVTVRAHELRQVIDISQDITDHIRIKVLPEKLIMQNSGDTGSAKLELEKEFLEELECEEPIESTFALEYFSKMVKTIGKNNLLRIELANKHPIKMQFSIADDNGIAVYLLAPRIES